MKAPPQPDPDPGKGVTRTLGDVLYANAAGPISESVWVDLVQSIARGDQLALRALYDRAHRIVFTYIVRITGNRETAEELTIDVFHDVWRRAATYRDTGGSVLGWIMNQARSRAIDRVRFDQRAKRAGDRADGSLSGLAAADGHDRLACDEQRHRLHLALERLTPLERQAIETAYFAELTYREAAQRLNEPLGTVKTRIRSGLAKLRDTLGGREVS